MTDNIDTSASATSAPSALPKTLDDVSDAYYGPDDLAKAGTDLEHIATLGKLVYAGDYSAGIPEGFGLLVMPVGGERTLDDGSIKRTTSYITVAAVPTLETVASAAGGADFLLSAILDQYKRKLRNASKSGNFPSSVSDYITKTTKQADPGLAAYKALAPEMCKYLKGKIQTTPIQLRQALQSTMSATAMYPHVAQGVWVKILNALIAAAAEKGLSPSTLQHWLATRDQVGQLDNVDDIDL